MKPAKRAAILLAIFAADRATKLWALEWLMPRGGLKVLPFFDLTYVENTGAAFGIGFARNGMFALISLGLLGAIFYLQRLWTRRNAWLQLGLVLVAGGAIGNLYDRMAYGFVVDFLDFKRWPVFNVADSCVTVGACCLAWGLRLEELAEKAKKEA